MKAMSRFRLSLAVTTALAGWYAEAAEDKRITPEEAVDLLQRIAAVLGLADRLHINVEPME